MPMTELFAGPFPTLRTERLTLRELCDEDAEYFHEVYSDTGVMQYISLPDQREEDSRERMNRNRALFAAGLGIRWAITRRDEPRAIGSCGHWRINKPDLRSEIGFELRRSAWGQGYMQEALTAMLRFGFRELELHSVEAQVDPDNRACRSTLTALGFRQEGHLRENYRIGERYVDTLYFGLIDRDFLSTQPPGMSSEK